MQPPYRLLWAAAVTGAGLLLLYFLLPYTLPFLLALLLAAIIDRPVDALERRLRLPRGLVVAIVLAGAVGAAGLVAGVVLANVAAELDALYRRLPQYSDLWRAALEEALGRLERLRAMMPRPVGELLARSVEDALSLVGQSVSGLLGQVQRLPDWFASLLIAAVTTYFLSRDKRGLAAAYLRLLPPAWHGRLFELKRYIAVGSLGWVRGYLILLGVTFAVATAALRAFGVGYAWLLGLLAALLDVMPLVGPSGVFLPIIAFFALGGETGRALGLALVWAAMVLLRQVLEARVMGAQLGVHPLTMIFALYTGVKVFGANGLWLAPFIVVAVKAAYTVLYPAGRA